MYLDIFFTLFFTIIFITGSVGFFTSNYNLIKLFISLEVQFIALLSLFLFFFIFSGNATSLIISLYIFILAGCESAMGLMIFLVLTRYEFPIKIYTFTFLKH